MNENDLKKHFQNLAKTAGNDDALTQDIMENLDAGSRGFWRYWLARMREHLVLAIGVLVICLAVGWVLQAMYHHSPGVERPLFQAVAESGPGDMEIAEFQQSPLSPRGSMSTTNGTLSQGISFIEVLARGIFPIAVYLLGFWLFILAVGMEIPENILDEKKEKILC